MSLLLLYLNFIFVVAACFQGAESHESSKTNADETETQTSESQKNETSSEQRVDYQRDPNQMDETEATNSESDRLPHEKQKTEEVDDFVMVDEVPSKT